MEIEQWALVILVLLPAAAGFPIFLYALVKTFHLWFTLPLHKRADVEWRDVPFAKFNHFNIMFVPEYLSDTGREKRAALFRHLVVGAIGLVLVFTTKQLMDHMNAL